MKFNKILLIIAFAAINQSVFAAVMSVYNETGNPVDVRVVTMNNMLPPKDIPIGKKVSFNSGIYAFKNITWIPWHQPDNNRMSYSCDIPSTKFMLMGTIVLYPDGKLALNFDDRGASSNKLVGRTASPRRIPGKY
jgi:hypothetical protein